MWWRSIRTIPRRRNVHVKRLGLTIELNLRDHTQYIVYREGSYEPALRQQLVGELARDDIVADIGAHIGIHALVMAAQLRRLGGGHVYAFEPTPDSGNRIKATASENAITNITLVPAAVSDHAGAVVLRSDPAFTVHDAGVRSQFGPGAVVGSFPTMRLDDWALDVALERLDIVKIDVEGGELAALVGMRATLARLRPRLVVVEVNDVTLSRAGVSRQRLYDELANSGYRPAEELRDHGSIVNVAFRPAMAHGGQEA